MGNALLAMVKRAFLFSDEHLDTFKASACLLLRIIQINCVINAIQK